MVVALCVLGVFTFLLTTGLVICFVHFDNISRQKKIPKEKKKMNNLKTNFAKTENEDDE